MNIHHGEVHSSHRQDPTLIDRDGAGGFAGESRGEGDDLQRENSLRSPHLRVQRIWLRGFQYGESGGTSCYAGGEWPSGFTQQPTPSQPCRS